MNSKALLNEISNGIIYRPRMTTSHETSFRYNASFTWRIFLIIFWASLITFFSMSLLKMGQPLVQFLGWGILIAGLYKVSNVFRDHVVILEEDKILIPKSSLSRQHDLLKFKDIKNMELMYGEELVIQRSDGKYFLLSESIIGKKNFLLAINAIYEGSRNHQKIYRVELPKLSSSV